MWMATSVQARCNDENRAHRERLAKRRVRFPTRTYSCWSAKYEQSGSCRQVAQHGVHRARAVLQSVLRADGVHVRKHLVGGALEKVHVGEVVHVRVSYRVEHNVNVVGKGARVPHDGGLVGPHGVRGPQASGRAPARDDAEREPSLADASGGQLDGHKGVRRQSFRAGRADIIELGPDAEPWAHEESVSGGRRLHDAPHATLQWTALLVPVEAELVANCLRASARVEVEMVLVNRRVTEQRTGARVDVAEDVARDSANTSGVRSQRMRRNIADTDVQEFPPWVRKGPSERHPLAGRARLHGIRCRVQERAVLFRRVVRRLLDGVGVSKCTPFSQRHAFTKP